LKGLLQGRRYGFDVERAIYLTVLHRLFVSGSDRQAERWKENYRIRGCDGLELHQLYRAMAFLGTPLAREEQKDKTPFAPRCLKDLVEEQWFDRRRDLFTDVDLVFFDTTSIYFVGEGGETIGRRGKSKDHRPELKQMVVGLVIDKQGRPLCCEMWPGNTTDVKTLLPIVRRLKKRFGIRQVCIVADRGMISKETVRELEAPDSEVKYILGVRMRQQTEVRDNVLGRAGAYHEVVAPRRQRKDPSPLKVKEVWQAERRYIVCLNEDQRAKDAADRLAIVAGLKEHLTRGDKSLIGNKGYRRFVKTLGEERFEVDERKITEESRFDGKWVLTTNTDLSATELALTYKQLWMVEELFRTMKSIIDSRPIYHKCDETIRGHVFCSFLPLCLRKELADRLEAIAPNAEWMDVLRDLNQLQEVLTVFSGKKFVIRSQLKGCAHAVLQAAGVAAPPTLRQIE
jgi:transposase